MHGAVILRKCESMPNSVALIPLPTPPAGMDHTITTLFVLLLHFHIPVAIEQSGCSTTLACHRTDRAVTLSINPAQIDSTVILLCFPQSLSCRWPQTYSCSPRVLSSAHSTAQRRQKYGDAMNWQMRGVQWVMCWYQRDMHTTHLAAQRQWTLNPTFSCTTTQPQITALLQCTMHEHTLPALLPSGQHHLLAVQLKLPENGLQNRTANRCSHGVSLTAESAQSKKQTCMKAAKRCNCQREAGSDWVNIESTQSIRQQAAAGLLSADFSVECLPGRL